MLIKTTIEIEKTKNTINERHYDERGNLTYARGEILPDQHSAYEAPRQSFSQ